MQQIATKNNQLPSPSAPTYAFQIGAGGNNATPIIGEIKEFYLFAGILRSDYQSLLDRNSVITKGSFGVKISSQADLDYLFLKSGICLKSPCTINGSGKPNFKIRSLIVLDYLLGGSVSLVVDDVYNLGTTLTQDPVTKVALK